MDCGEFCQLLKNMLLVRCCRQHGAALAPKEQGGSSSKGSTQDVNEGSQDSTRRRAQGWSQGGAQRRHCDRGVSRRRRLGFGVGAAGLPIAAAAAAAEPPARPPPGDAVALPS